MRLLGIDYGRKRVGLALSDATGTLARPWKTLTVRGGLPQLASDLAREIEYLCAESDGLETVVVGLPRRLSGEPNEQTVLVEGLADRLRRLVSVPLVLQDERLSSHEAESLLSRTEKDWRKRKRALDETAAAIILQDYLDTRPGEPLSSTQR
jgi:putative Holliday junction resolvase